MDVKLNPTTWEDGAHYALHKISNALSYGSTNDPVLHARSTAGQIREGLDHYGPTDYLIDGRFFLDVIQERDEFWGFDEIVNVLAEKHSKYGPGNIVGLGHLGIAVRLHDKMERIIHCASLDIVDEENPMFDALGYCVVGVMLTEGWFELPLAADTAILPVQIGTVGSITAISTDDPPEDYIELVWNAEIRAWQMAWKF